MTLGRHGALTKALLGGALVVTLVLLIWGPLLFISVVNTTISQPNPPVSTSIDVSIDGISVRMGGRGINLSPAIRDKSSEFINRTVEQTTV